jgi:hypothetical protein
MKATITFACACALGATFGSMSAPSAALAGPTGVAASGVVSMPIQVDTVHYWRYRHRPHYGYYRRPYYGFRGYHRYYARPYYYPSYSYYYPSYYYPGYSYPYYYGPGLGLGVGFGW